VKVQLRGHKVRGREVLANYGGNLLGIARNGYAGLQFRLRAVAEGKFGDILSRRPALDWSAVSSRPGVTYLGLPTTAAAEDVELFGRIVVQDLKDQGGG
jgi:hypothetical protein